MGVGPWQGFMVFIFERIVTSRARWKVEMPLLGSLRDLRRGAELVVNKALI